MYMSKKYLQKLEKHLWRGLFCESFGITYHSLRWFVKNLTKVFHVALKYKKSSYDDNEGKSAFQPIAIELYKQPKNKAKKNH